ncbi:hypothetical protein ACJ41O_003531 [Fusarium nematophilum]
MVYNVRPQALPNCANNGLDLRVEDVEASNLWASAGDKLPLRRKGALNLPDDRPLGNSVDGNDSALPVPAIFIFVPGMPVVVNHNTDQGLKLVNGASYTAVEVISNKAYPGHQISADITIHFGPPAGIILESETIRDFHFVGMPPGTILLTPISVKIHYQRKQPWQKNDISLQGLLCAAAFTDTDHKAQGGAFKRVALELRGTRTTNINGRVVSSQCDPYSLYV